nr:MAG TPA: hypothetical protein [Caudoviricetes sp.]
MRSLIKNPRGHCAAMPPGIFPIVVCLLSI